jgi:hypothetical protein
MRPSARSRIIGLAVFAVACATGAEATSIITTAAAFPAPYESVPLVGSDASNLDGISIAVTSGSAQLNPNIPDVGEVDGLVLWWAGTQTSYLFTFDAPILAFGALWDFVVADDPDGDEQFYEFELFANGVPLEEIEGLDEPHNDFFGFVYDTPFDSIRMNIEPSSVCFAGPFAGACNVAIVATDIRYVPAASQQPVPEPTSLLLFSLGVAVVGGWRRRRGAALPRP